MSTAIITCGGIGDVLESVKAGVVHMAHNQEPVDIYINSHQEIIDFVQKCTYFPAFPCPERTNSFKDVENPLNLPPLFLDSLFEKYDSVYSCFPDSLGQAPFAFPWFKFVKSYKEFLKTKVDIRTEHFFRYAAINSDTKNIFIHATSITMEKNYDLSKLQKLVNLFNKTNYNLIIARTSTWKGAQLPFFCQGKFYDMVDRPIGEVVDVMDKCDYFVGIDSGLAHISYHLGLPRLVLQQHFGQPFHISRYHEDVTDDLPLGVEPEHIFNRVMLNLRDPLTQAIPAYIAIPYTANTKQLLYKKYYD